MVRALVAPRDAAQKAQRGSLLDHEVLDILQHWSIRIWFEIAVHFWHLWLKLSSAAVPYDEEEDPHSTESIVNRE
jgi:hypothetical protein